jgi:hypothetical protein
LPQGRLSVEVVVSTTAIYADAVRTEEPAIAERM